MNILTIIIIIQIMYVIHNIIIKSINLNKILKYNFLKFFLFYKNPYSINFYKNIKLKNLTLLIMSLINLLLFLKIKMPNKIKPVLKLLGLIILLIIILLYLKNIKNYFNKILKGLKIIIIKVTYYSFKKKKAIKINYKLEKFNSVSKFIAIFITPLVVLCIHKFALPGIDESMYHVRGWARPGRLVT